MDSQLARAAIVVGISGVVFAIGAVLLVLAFRSFRTAKPGDIRHIVLLVIAIVFVFASSVVLLVWSMMQRG